MTTERIRLDETQEKTDIAKTLKSLIKSKPFISISLASLVLIMYQTLMCPSFSISARTISATRRLLPSVLFASTPVCSAVAVFVKAD